MTDHAGNIGTFNLPPFTYGDTDCGNGQLDFGEVCDPGKSCENGTDCTDDPFLCPTGPAECYARITDTCNPACEPSRCGDRYIDPDGMNNQGGDYDDEECDEGSYCNDFVTDCSRDPSICPGGIFECRPRLKNGCSGFCSDASCGDGTLDIN